MRDRRFRRFPEPYFRDALRVNLTLPEHYWIAYALWPPNERGSKEKVEELLAAILPKERPESARQ